MSPAPGADRISHTELASSAFDLEGDLRVDAVHRDLLTLDLGFELLHVD